MSEESVLVHHGVKGMRWGVRRYQNKDGTLTAEGRRRYYTSDGDLTREGHAYNVVFVRKRTDIRMLL